MFHCMIYITFIRQIIRYIINISFLFIFCFLIPLPIDCNTRITDFDGDAKITLFIDGILIPVEQVPYDAINIAFFLYLIYVVFLLVDPHQFPVYKEYFSVRFFFFIFSYKTLPCKST